LAYEASPNNHNGEGMYWLPKAKAPSLMGDDEGPRPHRKAVAATGFGDTGKVFEGCFSLADLALGLSIIIDPHIGSGTILVVARSILGFSGMVVFLVNLGLIGVTSLLFSILSRSSIWSRLRVMCNIGRVMLWWSIANSMVLTHIQTGHLSPMVLYSIALLSIGVFVVYMAARDVRTKS
jgi:hypothetical protein